MTWPTRAAVEADMRMWRNHGNDTLVVSPAAYAEMRVFGMIGCEACEADDHMATHYPDPNRCRNDDCDCTMPTPR